MDKLVACVPNVSEGRDRAVIEAIAAEIRGVDGVALLDVDAGAATNRTVYTFAGPPAGVAEAALRMARKVAALVDMSRHRGAHPRIGALDVCPIVPLGGVTLEECAGIARALGERIASELHIPVYFYERAAARDTRRNLADIRAGEYEGLPGKLRNPEWAPDCGAPVFNPRLGATVVGAREWLIAFNVDLNTRDRRLAHEIALRIRESGRLARAAGGDAGGPPVRTPGRLKATRAIGWYIDEYRQAQVSVNLLDFKTTPLHVVFETVREEAERLGLLVTGSELVGMAPLHALAEAGRFYLRRQRKSSGAPESELIEVAVRSLGLDRRGAFDPRKKIVEYAVRLSAPLLAMPVERFLDEVSSETPTPGGGSAAALAGSIGAALVAMLANLTAGRPGPNVTEAETIALAERAQAAKQALAELVDEDARAFDAVMAARRLPKATEVDRGIRHAAVQTAMRRATEVPLATARLSLDALELARSAAAAGRRDAVSDAGVAALLAHAALEGAVLNVLINLPGIEDAAFAHEARAEAQRLRGLARPMCDEVLGQIHDGLGSQPAAR